jgi:TatD DNase family protein
VRFVDSHLHLDSGDVPADLSLAEAGQIMLLACGIDASTSHDVITLAQAHPETVRAFIGVHPSEAVKSKELRWFGRSLARATGVGEIGLDPKYSSTGQGGSQMRALLTQLEAAQKHGKPVQVHSRDAEKETLGVLGSFDLKGVLMHWFEGESLLSDVIARGYYVSFGPAVLFSKKLQRIAGRLDPGRVLTETDSPIQYRPLGNRHGPSLIPSVVFKLAEIWSVSFDEARERTTQNAARFLGTSEKG